MKLECLKNKFQEAVILAERFVGKNLSLPILSNIILEASTNTLLVRATNLDLGLEVSLPIKAEKIGTVAVNGSVLVNFLTNLPHKNKIILELVGEHLTISTPTQTTIIKASPATDFPIIPRVDAGGALTLSTTGLVNGLRSVWYASSFTHLKPEISSVYLNHQQNNLVFAATDSFRLAEKRLVAPLDDKTNPLSLIIPLKNIIEIIKVLESPALPPEITLKYNNNQLSLNAESFYLTSRLIDGVFPDYQQIIPSEFETSLVVLKRDLIDNLKLVSVFSDKFHQVDLGVSRGDQSVELKSRGDLGETSAQLEATIEGNDAQISFNAKYFIDCFQSLPGDSVQIGLNGPRKPLVVRGVGDASFTYLIMPVNR